MITNNKYLKEKKYKILILGLLFLQLLWFFVPWGFAYGDGSQVALYLLGANAHFNENFIIFISNLITFLYILTYIGLLFFQNWARYMMVGICFIGGLGIPFYGLSVESAYESAIGYFLTIGDGFIIAISFFSNIANKFTGRDIEY